MNEGRSGFYFSRLPALLVLMLLSLGWGAAPGQCNDSLEFTPPITCQPAEGEPVDLRAGTLDLLKSGDGLWLGWTTAPEYGESPQVNLTRLPIHPVRPALATIGLSGPPFDSLRELALVPVAGESTLVLFYGRDSSAGDQLWLAEIPNGNMPDEPVIPRMIPGIAGGLYSWDAISWGDDCLVVWASRALQQPLKIEAMMIDASGHPGDAWLITSQEAGVNPVAAGSSNGGLAAWSIFGSKIAGRLLDGTGRPAGAPLSLWEIPPDRRVDQIQIAATAHGYLVGWVSDALQAENRELRMGRIDSAGAVLDSSGVLISTGALTDEIDLDIEWTGGSGEVGWAVWWDLYDRLVGRRFCLTIDDSIRFLDEEPVRLIAPTRTEPAATYSQVALTSGGGWFWAAAIRTAVSTPAGDIAGEIWGQAINPDGVRESADGLSLIQRTDPVNPSVLWDSRDYIVYLFSPMWDGGAYFPFMVNPVTLRVYPQSPVRTTAHPEDPHVEAADPFGTFQVRMMRRPVNAIEIVRLNRLHHLENSIHFRLLDEGPVSPPSLILQRGELFVAAVDGGRVWIRVIDAYLTLLTERSLGGESGMPEQVKIVDVAGELYLFWSEVDDGRLVLRRSRLAAGAFPQPPEGEWVLEMPSEGGWTAAGSEEYGFVVWTGGAAADSLLAFRFNVQGTRLDLDPLFLAATRAVEPHPAAVWDGRTFVIHCSEDTGTQLVRVDESGSVLSVDWVPGDVVIKDSAAGAGPSVLLAEDGGRIRLMLEPPGPPMPFALMSPADNDTLWVNRPTFRWQAAQDIDVDDNVTYTLNIALNPNFEEAILYPALEDTFYTIPNELSGDSLYYWDVTASDRFGLSRSSANGRRKFTISSESTPAFVQEFSTRFAADRKIVEMTWVFRGENNLRGVFIDRRIEDGPWVRLTAIPLPVGLSGPFIDTEPPEWATLDYRLVGMWDGSVETILVSSQVFTAVIQGSSHLLPPYPNPMTGSVTIRFELAESGRVSISIYDVQGRLVDKVQDKRYSIGPHTTYWDGRDSVENRVAGGIYILKFEYPGGVKHSKIIVSGDR